MHLHIMEQPPRQYHQSCQLRKAGGRLVVAYYVGSRPDALLGAEALRAEVG